MATNNLGESGIRHDTLLSRWRSFLPRLAFYKPWISVIATGNLWALVSAATVLCVVLTVISSFVPPSMYSDSGYGFLAWRGTLAGNFNSIVAPDPSDLSRDIATFLTAWSPGQYLVPGVISLLGMPFGVALTLTSTVCLAIGLLGWALFVRVFVPQSSVALMSVLFMETFRYSTLPFGIYNGGEILLQGATPWIFLAALRIPQMGAIHAGLLAGFVTLGGFFVKLTGLIVVASALTAGAMIALASARRVSAGTLGGAVGSALSLTAVYFFFLSRGWNASEGSGWSVPVGSLAFSLVVPWVSGFSWTDFLDWLLRHPGYQILTDEDLVTWFALPVSLYIFGVIVFCRTSGPNIRQLRFFVLSTYTVFVALFAIIFCHGADISLEERHFRSLGTLIFLGGFALALQSTTPILLKASFLGLCMCMSLYGIASFASRALAAADGRFLDPASWTNQSIVDRAAIQFLQEAYREEGRSAVFVLPSSVLSVTLPESARIITVDLDFDSESEVAALHYEGRVSGHVYVLEQNRIANTPKGQALLDAFTSYKLSSWDQKAFLTSSVFVQ